MLVVTIARLLLALLVDLHCKFTLVNVLVLLKIRTAKKMFC